VKTTPKVLIALSIVTMPAAFAATPAVNGPAIEHGRRVFQTWCQACHGPGADRPGTLGLEAKYNGRLPALLEERTDLTSEFVKIYVRKGFAMMAPFRKTEISDTDLDALCAYMTRPRQ
jgi:mono/diheme cytochrome c family protein